MQRDLALHVPEVLYPYHHVTLGISKKTISQDFLSLPAPPFFFFGPSGHHFLCLSCNYSLRVIALLPSLEALAFYSTFSSLTHPSKSPFLPQSRTRLLGSEYAKLDSMCIAIIITSKNMWHHLKWRLNYNSYQGSIKLGNQLCNANTCREYFSVPQKDSHSHSRSQAQTRYITNYTKGHK